MIIIGLFYASNAFFGCHVSTRGLILDEVDCVGRDKLPLAFLIHLRVLVLHLLCELAAVLLLGHLEQLVLRRIDFHELDPVPHARQQVAPWLVCQNHMPCCPLFTIHFLNVVLLSALAIGLGYCQHLHLIKIILLYLVVGRVNNRSSHRFYVTLATFCHFSNNLQLRRRACSQFLLIEI